MVYDIVRPRMRDGCDCPPVVQGVDDPPRLLLRYPTLKLAASFETRQTFSLFATWGKIQVIARQRVTVLAVGKISFALTLAEKLSFCVRFDQRPSLSLIFRMGVEVGLEPRRLNAEFVERAAATKGDHHPRCFFVRKSSRSRCHFAAPSSALLRKRMRNLSRGRPVALRAIAFPQSKRTRSESVILLSPLPRPSLSGAFGGN
jgi:hypothetical protein